MTEHATTLINEKFQAGAAPAAFVMTGDKHYAFQGKDPFNDIIKKFPPLRKGWRSVGTPLAMTIDIPTKEEAKEQ